MYIYIYILILFFPKSYLELHEVIDGEELPTNARDVRDAGWIPGSGRRPEGRHVSPLQDSCLENPMDRGTWQATVHSASKTDMTEVTKQACMKEQNFPFHKFLLHIT